MRRCPLRHRGGSPRTGRAGPCRRCTSTRTTRRAPRGRPVERRRRVENPADPMGGVRYGVVGSALRALVGDALHAHARESRLDPPKARRVDPDAVDLPDVGGVLRPAARPLRRPARLQGREPDGADRGQAARLDEVLLGDAGDPRLEEGVEALEAPQRGVALDQGASVEGERAEADGDPADDRVDPEVGARRVAGEVEGVEGAVVEPLAREPLPHGGHVPQAHGEIDVAVEPPRVPAGGEPGGEPPFEENGAPEGVCAHDAQRGGHRRGERGAFRGAFRLIRYDGVEGAAFAPGFATVHGGSPYPVQGALVDGLSPDGARPSLTAVVRI